MNAENSVSRNSLLKAILLVRPTLASQDFIPALTHVLLEGGIATTYNDVSSISVRCEEFPIACCLPGDLLIKTLNSFTGDKILVTSADSNAVVLASGRSKIKLPSLELSDFPFTLPAETPMGKIKVTKSILEGIEKCLMAVGTDPTHPAQMGVTVESDGTLYSTDNYTISRYKTKSGIALPGDIPIILPAFFCTQLVALAKQFPSDSLVIELHNGSLVAEFGDGECTLFTKCLVDLEPMDFPKILGKYLTKDSSTDAVKLPDEFDSAFERALLVLSSDADKITKVAISNGAMKLSSTSQMGEAKDNLPFDAVEDFDPFHIDPVLVLRGAKQCSKVILHTSTIVLCNEDQSFVHLIAHSQV